MVRNWYYIPALSVLYTLRIIFSGARRDEDGYLWVTGRVDDMLNVSGHLMSTAEVESVLVEHEDVAEAAVVSQPHAVKGECLYCFITPNSGVEFSKKLVDELKTKGNFLHPHTQKKKIFYFLFFLKADTVMMLRQLLNAFLGSVLCFLAISN